MRSIIATVAFAITLAAAALTASGTVAHAADQANVRMVYVSPDGPNVDLYWDSSQALTNVTYKTVSTYMTVPPGAHDFRVNQAGSSTAMVAQVQSSLASGSFNTIVVGGKSGQLRAAVFNDAISTPGQGQASARFIHTAPEVPGVDVAVKGGPVLFTNISFLQASSYGSLAAGSYDLELRSTGTDQVLFTATGVVASRGTIHSLAAVGGVGRPIELLQIADADSTASTPSGGADTGGGGMVIRQPAALTLVGLSLLLTCLLGATAIRRQRRPL
ncbi:MAG: DUF4397 domain-containing protein [Candidatus Dormibacteraeota bacterium]|nr:DUF4397 domain-containing protein [Candidatus Dormibacteraeota bacterium]